jgi:hypothetical protein
MPSRIRLFAAGLVIATSAIGLAAPPRAQPADLTEWLRRNAREARLENRRLIGPGAAWLLEQASKAQFVFIGEEHGIAEIPMFAAALWRGLVPLGYRHIALEEGPWVMELADRYVRRGDTVALSRYLAAVAPDLPMGSLEHRQFLDSVRRTPVGGTTGRLWGLDQEMRPGPIFRRLAELAPNAKARALAARAASKADSSKVRVILGYGSEIAELERAFATASDESRRLIRLLEQSNRLYESNAAPRDSLRGYQSNREREDMMKDLFLVRYREAQRRDERRPRVMLQFGSFHGMRGMSPTHVFTLANFLADLARAEGATGGSEGLFNLALTCGKGGERSGVGEDVGKTLPCGADEAEWAKPLLEAGLGRWTVFDLRPLRAAIHAGVLKVAEPLNTIVFGYDALVTIAGTTGMHFPLLH